MKRINKSKKQIVSDIQLVQDTDRRRALIKDVIFPYLVEMNDTIGYSKVFLQAFSGLVNGVYEDYRKSTTIGEITPKLVIKLNEVFKVKDVEQKKEFDRYLKLIGMLSEVSVQDLFYATELPRYIDGFIVKTKDKESIKDVPLEKILG